MDISRYGMEQQYAFPLMIAVFLKKKECLILDSQRELMLFAAGVAIGGR